jgi:hypothetical protein
MVALGLQWGVLIIPVVTQSAWRFLKRIYLGFSLCNSNITSK